MDLFANIASGVAVVLLGALVLYAFKVKQLYLLVPKMFSYGGLTGKGKIIELRAFNKGRSMEEDVHIDMPPALTYELIAADHPDVLIAKNKVTLSRIAPKSEVSMILLAEGPIEAESFAPTLSSKTTKGKVVKKLEEVPPNIGSVVLLVCGFLIFMSLLWFVPTKVIEYQKKALLDRYAFLDKSGWRGLDRYVSSEARASYAGFEFPISLNSAKRTGETFEITFTATNKTAAPLNVTAYFALEDEDKRSPLVGKKSVFDVLVNPMQSVPIVIGTKISPDLPKSKLFVTFSLKFGEDTLWGIRFYPSLNKAANEALQQDAPQAARH